MCKTPESEFNEFEQRLKSTKIERRLKSSNIEYISKWKQPRKHNWMIQLDDNFLSQAG